MTFKRISKILPLDRTVFGARLRQARQRAGLPQDKLGVLVGIDEHSASARMSRYENGIHEPPIATARLLAAVLKVPLAYLYCDDDLLAEVVLATHGLSWDDKEILLEFIRKRISETQEVLPADRLNPSV